MEIFGMARRALSPGKSYEEDVDNDASFDYLKDATKKGSGISGSNANESISFLLDASAIASGSIATDSVNTNNNNKGDNGSNASNKEGKNAFYSLHDTAVSEFLSPSPPKKTVVGKSSRKSRIPIANPRTKKPDPKSKYNNLKQSRSNLPLPTELSPGSAASSPRAATTPPSPTRIYGTKSNPIRLTPKPPSPKPTSASPKRVVPTSPSSPFLLPSLASSKPSPDKAATKTATSLKPTIRTRRSVSSTKNSSGTKRGGVHTTTLKTPGSGRGIPQTPGGFWTTNTESKSFVNGLLSPFSPLLNAPPNFTANQLDTIFDDDPAAAANINNNVATMKQKRDEYLQYVSLQPCRKVSVVVRVSEVDENDDDAKRCIFPHYKEDSILPGDTSILTEGFSTPKGKRPQSPLASPNRSKTNGLTSPPHGRDVVVVNPQAFGKYIPSQVTMETAKLVAQVANIASEDWARLYEFHHVMWPQANGGTNTTPPSQTNEIPNPTGTMDSLSRAVVQDLLAEHKSSLLISLGHESSCFGTLTTPGISKNKTTIGVWPKIMNQCAAMLDTKGVVRLTMVEILEPSSGSEFRDLLAPTDQKPNPISLHHPDMKGAVLEGLTEVEIDSMPALLEALARSRTKRAQRRSKQGKSGAPVSTALIGTLHYWEHAVSYELHKPSNATVTCVELATSSEPIVVPKKGKKSKPTTKKPTTKTETLESIAQRKSVVSLGQALRQLLLQTAHGHEQALGLTTSELAPVISYRETTLTKVLQRSMESSKIVLIASISPLSRDYDQTVVTLNYLRRLLVKPGDTLTSPFGGRNNDHKHKATPKTAKTDNRSTINGANKKTNDSFDNTTVNQSTVNRSIMTSPEAIENKEKLRNMTNQNPKLLENLVADPRQRLARLFGQSPRKKTSNKPWSNVLDRMEDSHKSTRGTPSAISLSGASNNSGSRANSYAGPPSEVEARQVVESPSSHQHSRQSWQAEEPDDEDERGMKDYEIQYEGDKVGNAAGEESDEWDSEEEIERELLMSARLKERTLEAEMKEIENNLYPNENFSYEEEEEEDYEEEAPLQEGVAQEPQHHHGQVLRSSPTEAIEVDLQGVAVHSPQSEEIVPEGSYYDEEQDDEGQHLEYDLPGEGDEIPSAPTDLTNLIQNHLEEEFPDETLGLNSTAQVVETVHATDTIEDNSQPVFTDEEWQEGTDGTATHEGTEGSSLGLRTIEAIAQGDDHEGTEAGSLGLHPIEASARHESPPVSPPITPRVTASFDDNSVEGAGNQTNYDLPDDPLPIQNKSRVQSAPTTPKSPYQQRSAFNSYASPYSVTLKTTKSKEYSEITTLTNEREELRNTVSTLKEDLQKISEDRDTHIQQYESQIEQLYAKLEEAAVAKRDLEEVADKEIQIRATRDREMEEFEDERDRMQQTIDDLRNDLTRASQSNSNQVMSQQVEIEDLRSKLTMAQDMKKEIEEIANEAVNANRIQVEETRVLASERVELQSTIDTLQSTMQSLEKDQGDHITQYKQEIRQLHSKLEDATKLKRTLEQNADDARFQLETVSEKLRLLHREREELHMTLNSVKGSAQKASGDNDEYIRQLKLEIQELHAKLDDAHSDKLRVEKAVDEIRFARDDLERSVKCLEEELSLSRSNTLRLEGIRREEQETIRKMHAELRRKDSEKIEMEHFRSELERLKRQKDHLEGIVAQRNVESSSVLQRLEDELAETKRFNLRLEKDLSAARIDISESEKQKLELAEKLRVAYDENAELSRRLGVRDETVQRLQSTVDQLESIRNADKNTIAKLRDELQNRDSSAFDIEQLNHKISRLKQDNDHLQHMMETRRSEFERSMDEKTDEVTNYANEVMTLRRDVEIANANSTRYRNDAEAQLRSLQESESNLIQELRQRDAKIAKFQLDVTTKSDEINALREREASTTNAEHEVNRLRERMTNLEATLDATAKEREEAVEKARSESRSQKSLLNELEQYKNDINRYKNAVSNLNTELDERQEECLKAKERIFEMESTLRDFKKETRERVSTIADRESYSNSILERTRHANQDLMTNVQNLNGTVERLRRERDICFETLKDGKEKLSEFSAKKKSLRHMEDPLSTPPNPNPPLRQGSPRRREPRPAPRSHRPPVESITARASNRIVPEIYLSNYNLAALGSPTSLAEERAEEIAACVALNAKESLEENFEEVSQLRSQIYSLEAERSEQVASLRSKVQRLENELSYGRGSYRHAMQEQKNDEILSLRAKVRDLERKLDIERVGNRTPIMGSSSKRSRNHFVDSDRTYGDKKFAW